MGTAFMFYSNTNEWAQGLEGWHGVDQLGEDGANPNYEALLQRFRKRFGRDVGNVVVAGLRHRARCRPRHRQRDDRDPERGEAGPREDQVDAPPTVARAPTSRSRRTTTGVTRATS